MTTFYLPEIHNSVLPPSRVRAVAMRQLSPPGANGSLSLGLSEVRKAQHCSFQMNNVNVSIYNRTLLWRLF